MRLFIVIVAILFAGNYSSAEAESPELEREMEYASGHLASISEEARRQLELIDAGIPPPPETAARQARPLPETSNEAVPQSEAVREAGQFFSFGIFEKFISNFTNQTAGIASLYKSVISSVAVISNQTASIASSYASAVADFFENTLTVGKSSLERNIATVRQTNKKVSVNFTNQTAGIASLYKSVISSVAVISNQTASIASSYASAVADFFENTLTVGKSSLERNIATVRQTNKKVSVNFTNQTAGIASFTSSLITPITDFVTNFFTGGKSSEPETIIPLKQSDSKTTSFSNEETLFVTDSTSGLDNIELPALSIADSPSPESPASPPTAPERSDGGRGNLTPATYSLKPDITRREVLDMIQQSDIGNQTLIGALSVAAKENSLTVNQSISNLENKISIIQSNSIRQLDKPASFVSRTDSDIKNLSGTTIVDSTITSSSFSGTTGTFTGTFSGTTGTFSGNLTVSSQLTVAGTATSTVAGDTNFDSGTLYIDSINNQVGIGTTSPYAKLSVVGPVVAEYFYATSSTATSTFSGQLVSGFAPTLTHSFGSWSVGAAGANPLGASFIINPSSAASDSNLLSLSVNGSAKFLVDAEGDIFANGVTVVGGTTLSTTTAATFTVENNTVLGDSTTTDITYFNSRIADSLIPTADNALDLGDSANWLRWRTGYFGTSVGIGGTATSTGSQLTTSGAYLIDSNNTLSINTTNNKAVSFGTGNVSLPYASSTALTISGNSYLGTVSSGAWNGTAIGDAYIDDNITLTNLTQITNRAITDTTGTLTVTRGGTGQTSFGQGWLNSDGTTLSASTSPTVSYLTATSTTATSTFAGRINTSGITGGYAIDGSLVLQASSTNNSTLIGIGAGTGLFFDGMQNTAIGYQALNVTTSSDQNTAVGYKALFSNSGGLQNTAVGRMALNANNEGSQNTAFGTDSLFSNTDGYNNSAYGFSALYSNTTGIRNVALGFQAGDNITTGSSNIILGYNIDAPSATASNQLNIGNIIFGTGIDGTGSTLSSGNIGIGTTSPYAKLSVVGETVSSYFTATSTTATSTFAGGMSVAGSSGLTVLQNGNVGVGATSPGAKLDISAGNLDLDNTTNANQFGVISKNGTRFIHNFNYGNNGTVTTDGYNTFVGEGAGNLTMGSTAVSTTESSYNTAIGNGALQANTTGYYNTANGTYSLYYNTTGYNNTANGLRSLYSNTTGFQNTANGVDSLYSNTTGDSNTANGMYSLYANTTGDYNTANGYRSLYSNTTGSNNTANGTYSLYYNTTGYYNTANGVSSLSSNTTGNQNTANGYYSLFYNTTGSNNTANGIYSGYNPSNDIAQYRITTDTNMTLLGYGATKNNASELDNGIAIGAGAQVLASNQVVLGNDSITTTLLKGNVGIGTTSPYAKLSVVGETVSSYFTATSTTATSTFPYLSVTTNSNLGTVVGGVWQGTAIGSTYGGTGINSSALTGIAQIVAGTWSASSTLSTAFGGTGWNNIASGYAIFGNGAGALATSSSFYWDNNNSRLGIGTTTPDSKLTVFNNADDSAIEFSSASGSTYKWTMGLDYSDAGKFKIASSTALGSIDRFTIDGNGYVGIGTSTPARRLDVADSGNNNPQLRLSRETNIYTDLSVAQTTGDLSLSLYGTNADDISLFMPDGSTGANLWVCEGAACPNGISFTGGGNLFVEGVIKYATSTTPKTRRSIILTAAGAIVPTASGAAKTQVDGNHSYYVLDFDASSDEAAYWQWTMPDSYDNGVIDVTYYWEAGATSGDVVWCFQSTGIGANNSEDIDPSFASWPSECATDTAQANANDLALITETATSSRMTTGEYSIFKIFRDADVAGDTMTGDARLVKVKIEYGVATESD